MNHTFEGLDKEDIRLIIVSSVDVDNVTGCWNWSGTKTSLGYSRRS